MKTLFAPIALAATATCFSLACSVATGPESSPEDSVDSQESGVVACGQTTVKGVDVSKWNGSINWKSVKGAGVQFAFIKATQGTDYVDPQFSANWSNAKSAGVVRAPYHFFDPTVSGAAQAQHFLATVGALGAGDLPPALDLECPDGDANCLYQGGSGWAPGTTIRARVLEWLSAVEQATGKKPIIYTFSAYFSGAQMSTAGLDKYPLWQAMVSPSNGCFQVPSPWTKWYFWQNSWHGVVAGIPGEVDLDVFNGTLADLTAMASGAGGGPVPAPGACPYGDGLYCGGDGVDGNPLKLYSCSGGALTTVKACSLGCQYMPVGQDDQCAQGTVCPQGDGLYCGGHQVGGNPDVLYKCSAGVLSKLTACAAGCARMPDGTNDQCK